jgi:hypothetical protein
MRYATIQYIEDVGKGWDCASPRCKHPAILHIARSDHNRSMPARAMVYCGRHAAIIQRNLIGQLFKPGQRVLEYYGPNPHVPDPRRIISPHDYGTVKGRTPDGYILVQHDGFDNRDLHRIPENTGLWAVYE